MIHQQKELILITPMDLELVSGIVVFRHRTVKNDNLFRHLRTHGVVCAQRGGGIRFSPHFYTSKTIIKKAVRIAAEVSQ